MTRNWIAAALAILPLAACSRGDVSTTPTYYKDVKPIIDQKCNKCHEEGGIGPVPLQTYDEVARVKSAIQLQVGSGKMPPWKPADGCATYPANFSLSAEQKSTILDWIDQGAPAGDPANDASPGIAVADGLPRVDVTLDMPATYKAERTPDDYHCFVLDWPQGSLDTTKYVVGTQVLPGNKKVVHHVIAYYAGPSDAAAYRAADPDGKGYTCFGGPAPDGTTIGASNAPSWIAAWAPGANAGLYPPNTGLKVEPGSVIILQVHYNTITGGPQPDKSELQIMLADHVDKVAWIQPWTDITWLGTKNMDIPANDADVMHSVEYDPTTFPSGSFWPGQQGQPVKIYAAGLHMHLLGTQGYTAIKHPDGSDTCLLKIDDWDFNWQGSYGFDQPKVLNPGDKLYLECHWDNTAANQPYVNGLPQVPADRWWGDGSTDEMCLGIYYMSN